MGASETPEASWSPSVGVGLGQERQDQKDPETWLCSGTSPRITVSNRAWTPATGVRARGHPPLFPTSRFARREVQVWIPSGTTPHWCADAPCRNMTTLHPTHWVNVAQNCSLGSPSASRRRRRSWYGLVLCDRFLPSPSNGVRHAVLEHTVAGTHVLDEVLSGTAAPAPFGCPERWGRAR